MNPSSVFSERVIPNTKRSWTYRERVVGRARWLSGPLLFWWMRAVGWASRPYRGVSKVEKLFVIGIST